MLSSHFSPGLAPQVGQRMDRIFFSVTFITAYLHGMLGRNWSILTTSEAGESSSRGVVHAAVVHHLIMVRVGRKTGIVGAPVFPDACSVTD